MWLVSLGAIGVVAIMLGVIVARSVRSPAGPSHTGSTTTTTRTTDGLIPGVSTAPASAGPGRVNLAGADIVVPDGWRAKYSPDLIGGPYTWCLGPQASCAVMFHRYSPTHVGPSPETPVQGDMTHVCEQISSNPLVLKQARTSTFRRRQADYRLWTIECPNGTRTIAQYVVSDPPAFELVTTTTATGTQLAAILDSMSAIASTATLPTATPGGIRMYDQGQVTSAKAAGDGYDIVLRRYVGGSVNDWARTDVFTPYHVPSTLLPQGYPVGQLEHERLVLVTDGRRLTKVILAGG